MPQKGECAILLDIENISISAKKNLKAGLVPLIRAVVAELKTIARSYAPSGPAVAALALAGGKKHTARILASLVEEGFQVSVVPPGPSAADWALWSAGLMLAADEEVDMVVLATGDGRDPFPELLETLLASGKRVRVVSYDGAPMSMRAEGVEHSSLAPHLNLMFGENGVAETVVAAAPGAEEDPREAVKRSYREAARAILAGSSAEGFERATRNLADAYEVLEDELAGARERRFSFGRLFAALEAARASGRLRAESEEEVGWIAKALLNFTDAFDRLELYVPSANGRFAELIKERVTC